LIVTSRANNSDNEKRTGWPKEIKPLPNYLKIVLNSETSLIRQIKASIKLYNILSVGI